MQKIIFLDIDGVIATCSTVVDGMWGLSPDKQTMLGIILQNTGAKIVLSSSWRLPTVGETKAYMESQGFMFCDKIIGVTIRAYKYISKDCKVHLSIPRGVEIKQWIDTNIHSNNGKDWERKKIGVDYNYVILDDDTDMLLEQAKYFINTDAMKGMSSRDMRKAIKILNQTI